MATLPDVPPGYSIERHQGSCDTWRLMSTQGTKPPTGTSDFDARALYGSVRAPMISAGTRDEMIALAWARFEADDPAWAAVIETLRCTQE